MMTKGQDDQAELPTVSGAMEMSEGTAYIVRDGVAVSLRELRGEYRAGTFWTGGCVYGVAYRSYFPRPFTVTTEGEAFAYDSGVFFGELEEAVAVTSAIQFDALEPTLATIRDYVARRFAGMTACAGPEAVSTYATVMEATQKDVLAERNAFWDTVAETAEGARLQEDLPGTTEASPTTASVGEAQEEAG